MHHHSACVALPALGSVPPHAMWHDAMQLQRQVLPGLIAVCCCCCSTTVVDRSPQANWALTDCSVFVEPMAPLHLTHEGVLCVSVGDSPPVRVRHVVGVAWVL